MALQHHFVLVIENGKASIDWSMSVGIDENSTYDDSVGDWLTHSELSPSQMADYLRSAELATQIVEPYAPDLTEDE